MIQLTQNRGKMSFTMKKYEMSPSPVEFDDESKTPLLDRGDGQRRNRPNPLMACQLQKHLSLAHNVSNLEFSDCLCFNGTRPESPNMNLPTTMKAVVFNGPRQVVVQDRPVPRGERSASSVHELVRALHCESD